MRDLDLIEKRGKTATDIPRPSPPALDPLAFCLSYLSSSQPLLQRTLAPAPPLQPRSNPQKKQTNLGRNRLDHAPRPARLGRLPRRRRRAPRPSHRARGPRRLRAQLGVFFGSEDDSGQRPSGDGRALEGMLEREIRLLGAARGLAEQQEEVSRSSIFLFHFVLFFGFSSRLTEKHFESHSFSLSISSL